MATDRTRTVAGLLALPGVGHWTADYIAMRALADPDAFPIADLALRNVWRDLAGTGDAALSARAEQWRPWRAYAAMHLWREYSARGKK